MGKGGSRLTHELLSFLPVTMWAAVTCLPDQDGLQSPGTMSPNKAFLSVFC